MNNQLIATIRTAIMYGQYTKSEDKVKLDQEVLSFGDVLTEDEIETLVQLINPPETHKLYRLCFQRSEDVGKMIGETLHQGIGACGWTPEEEVVIERFLQDIAYALSIE